MREAERRRLTDPLSLHDLVARYERRPGLRAIRALLAEAGIGARVIRSELEERFQDFLIRAGHASHSPTHAFELDRARDRRLGAAGWRVIRITWRQLEQKPDLVEADLRRLLLRG